MLGGILVEAVPAEVLDEGFPRLGFHHLREDAVPVFHLILGEVRCADDASPVREYHVHSLLLEARNTGKDLGKGFLGADANDPHFARLVLLEDLGEADDRSLHVAAEKGRNDFSARAGIDDELDARGIHAVGLGEFEEDEVVIVAEGGAYAHGHGGGIRLDGLEEILHGLPGRILLHGHGNPFGLQGGQGSEVVMGQLALAEEVVEHDEGGRGGEVLALTLLSLQIVPSCGAAAAGLVDHDDVLLHQLLVGQDLLHGAAEHVPSPAGVGRGDELDGPGWLPFRRSRPRGCEQRDEHKNCEQLFHSSVSPFKI